MWCKMEDSVHQEVDSFWHQPFWKGLELEEKGTQEQAAGDVS